MAYNTAGADARRRLELRLAAQRLEPRLAGLELRLALFRLEHRLADDDGLSERLADDDG